MNGLQVLIHQAKLASLEQAHKRQVAHERGEDFNIFPVCKVDHYETIHSAILAEYLNPCGSHGQGDSFLRLFLRQLVKEVASDAEFYERFDPRNARVRTEYSISNGRMDILIQSEDAHHAIIIENKIFAPDRDTQLSRYATYAKKAWRNSYRLLYLTLLGDEPNPNSAKGVSYQKVSYNSTILSWIQDCIQHAKDKPFIYYTLLQYKNHLKHLLAPTMLHEKNNEVLEMMLENPLAAAEIISLASSWEEIVLKNVLFDPLESFAKDHNMTFVNELYSDKKGTGEGFGFVIEDGLTISFRTEQYGWRKWYYGVLDDRLEKPETHLLPGLTGGNSTWPYGWQYLDKHSNWTPKDLAEIATDKGDYLKYLKNIILQLVREMEDDHVIKALFNQ